MTYVLVNKACSDKDAGFEQVNISYKDSSLVINTQKYQHTDLGMAKGSTVSWDDAYKHALRYHYLNFLGMSTVFPLNLVETIAQHKEGIKRTSGKYWLTTLYMPVVRSLSPSQIRLNNAFAFEEPWDPEVEI